MANALVNTAKKKILDGDIDLTADTIKLMLLDDNHTPDIDAEEFIDDVSANEVSASGTYSAGGGTLASKVVTVDDTNDRAYFDAADVAFTSATITARYAYLYKDTGTPGTSPIIGYYDYTENKSSTAGTFTHSFTAPASGGALYLA
jgi:hypothetical protein